MSVEFKWDKPITAIANRITQTPKVGRFMAETTAMKFKPYIPRDSGTLMDSYITEPFLITYNTPYSHYQWRGISHSGTPLRHSKEKNPLAKSRWNEVPPDVVIDIAKATEDFIRSM